MAKYQRSENKPTATLDDDISNRKMRKMRKLKYKLEYLPDLFIEFRRKGISKETQSVINLNVSIPLTIFIHVRTNIYQQLRDI